MRLLAQLIDLYTIVVIVSVVMSWVQVDPRNPIAGFIYSVTEPLLEPIRRVLPTAGGLDFSPMVLILGLLLLRDLLG